MCYFLAFIGDFIFFIGTFKFIFRIYMWESVILTSFVAGIIQTLLYADFIFYFVKANQQERIMNFPV